MAQIMSSSLKNPGLNGRKQRKPLGNSGMTSVKSLNDYTVEVMNRLKGLDLIECLKNYEQRFLTLYRRRPKPSQKKKKMKEGKWLSEEALQIDEERREAKGKGERGRYTKLNVQFQRIPRRDEKAFFNEQGKEIEENNSMEKTRDLFKKIGDIKGIFHVRMDTIKDGNSKDITEAEEARKLRRTTQKRS